MQKDMKLMKELNTLNSIRISGIISESIVDGKGIRYVIFTQGCYLKCKNCHNYSSQDIFGGYLKNLDEIVEEFKSDPLLQGITLSGGEPSIQAKECAYLAKKAHELSLDVYLYSGYYYDDLLATNNIDILNLLNACDYLVDGPYIEDEKSLLLTFRGSSNQRIIDLNKTRLTNKLVLVNLDIKY
jgi:anaerobic ribonucleoside-triphosphate reductase activating protein